MQHHLLSIPAFVFFHFKIVNASSCALNVNCSIFKILLPEPVYLYTRGMIGWSSLYSVPADHEWYSALHEITSFPLAFVVWHAVTCLWCKLGMDRSDYSFRNDTTIQFMISNNKLGSIPSIHCLWPCCIPNQVRFTWQAKQLYTIVVFAATIEMPYYTMAPWPKNGRPIQWLQFTVFINTHFISMSVPLQMGCII